MVTVTLKLLLSLLCLQTRKLRIRFPEFMSLVADETWKNILGQLFFFFFFHFKNASLTFALMSIFLSVTCLND